MKKCFIYKNIFGFRLLTEYHSFLFGTREVIYMIKKVKKFPSPYGVSFILIIKVALNSNKFLLKLCFRLLTEYHSFLLEMKKEFKINGLGFRLLTEYHSFL